MFGNIPTGGLSLGKVITGISKSLNVVNQLIPLYREVKPVIGNAKTILSTLKEIGNTPRKSNPEKQVKITENLSQKKDDSISQIISNNNPVFFN